MKITIFMMENGTPKEGLVPKLDIWDTDSK